MVKSWRWQLSEREGGREASWWIIKREEEKTGAAPVRPSNTTGK
jgi:hypothetical protein